MDAAEHLDQADAVERPFLYRKNRVLRPNADLCAAWRIVPLVARRGPGRIKLEQPPSLIKEADAVERPFLNGEVQLLDPMEICTRHGESPLIARREPGWIKSEQQPYSQGPLPNQWLVRRDSGRRLARSDRL